MTENLQVTIASMPDGPLEPSHFSVQPGPMPEAEAGQVLCRTTAITIGAGQRAGLQGSASYAGAPQVGGVMGGSGIAVIEQSGVPGFKAGDLVRAPTGWQTYSAQDPEKLIAISDERDPGVLLGPLGNNGITAWFGLTEVGRIAERDTVVVSAAGGSVGHLVGQIAKAKGAKVVGVAGSDEKCAFLVDEFGFDVAINRKSADFRAEFKAATPDRIDIYYDNTGGDILQSALFRMAVGGRIVCCGVASQYDTATPAAGPRGVPGLLINNRVTMQGFLLFDYADRYEEARTAVANLIDSGRLKPKVTEYEGLESAPQAFVDLLAGKTVGTTMVLMR
ncbi:MAG: NADP-dependent oxidoreductase [Woeseiaceae bacterium]